MASALGPGKDPAQPAVSRVGRGQPAVGPGRGRRRPPLRWRLALLAVLLVPVIELAVVVAVGKVVGVGWTLLALVAFSALGAFLLKREGSAALRALRTALASGQMPVRELADAALVVVGGLLLLVPGFLTSLLGLFFALPATRPLTGRWLRRVVERRIATRVGIVRGEVV